jgi:hypothetical protein
VIGAIRRWWAGRGRLPDDLRAELEAEGLELLEEGISVSVIYRGYVALGQRPRSGHQSVRASLALTPRRLVVRGTLGTKLDVAHGDDWLRLELGASDRLLLAYDAADAQPGRAGEVEMTFETPRAEAIHATLRAWMPTPSN